MDRATAEHIVGIVNRCIGELVATLEVVERSVPIEEFERYKRGVAKVMNTFDLEVVDRVARDFPDLRPKADI